MVMATTEPTFTVDDMAKITAPTLVLVGDDDLIQLEPHLRALRGAAGGAVCVVPASSHALPVEKPDETARVILGFLAADLPPATLMPIRRADEATTP